MTDDPPITVDGYHFATTEYGESTVIDEAQVERDATFYTKCAEFLITGDDALLNEAFEERRIRD